MDGNQMLSGRGGASRDQKSQILTDKTADESEYPETVVFESTGLRQSFQ
jgi:hypothetical protein